METARSEPHIETRSSANRRRMRMTSTGIPSTCCVDMSGVFPPSNPPALSCVDLRASFLVGNERNEADQFTKGIYRLPVDHSNELELLRVGRGGRDNYSSPLAGV